VRGVRWHDTCAGCRFNLHRWINFCALDANLHRAVLILVLQRLRRHANLAGEQGGGAKSSSVISYHMAAEKLPLREDSDECGEAIFLSSVCWQLRNLCPLLCVSCHRLLPWTLRLRTRSAKRKVCIAKEATLSSSVYRPVWDCSRIYKVDVSSQLRRQLGGWWARSECFGCAQRIRNEEGRKGGREEGTDYCRPA